jgi:hypothetical protein
MVAEGINIDNDAARGIDQVTAFARG